MKKTMLSIAALILAASFIQAQPQGGRPQPPQGGRPQPAGQPGQPQNTVQARVGETYAKPHDTYTPSFKNDGKETKVKNVILLIGDGMGLGATASAYFANGGALTMTNLRTYGYVLTQSADNFTTDSAASGTAYATGHKTKNGYLGMDPDGKKLTNIPEIIEPLGYACGVLSTDELTGATPAAFFAHQMARGNSDGIWNDLPTSHLIFASAGTMSSFDKQPFMTQDNIKKQFTLVGDRNDPSIAGSKKLLYLPPSVQLDRGDYLPATTEMAINYLNDRSKKGFFLMVEGARIDKEAHSNKLEQVVAETLDFDQAVEAAIRFAEKDGHTLVLISADHETGSIIARKGDLEENYVQSSFASTGHSPMMVPVYVYGPHSRDFTGYQHNSDICNKIVELLTKGKVSGR